VNRSATVTAPTVRVAFAMEQHLGHATYAANLRGALAGDGSLHQHWVDVRYAPAGRWWERVPGLPSSAVGALRGRDEVRRCWPGATPDVALFNTQVVAALGGRAVRRQPYVVCLDVTPRQYDEMGPHFGHRPDGAGPAGRIKHLLNVRVLRGAGAVVAWSRWVRSSLVADYGVEPAKVEVIPPGIDLARWRPAHRVGAGPVRILFVGGAFTRKGGPALVSAFRSLPPGTAELVLVTKEPVAGGPGIQVVDDLEPNSAELVELYRSSDVFALPSAAEPFGIAAVEASAVGLPVLGSRSGGLADVVVDGETGFTVDAGDDRALGDRLRRLVTDPDRRRRFGLAGRARAEQLFDADGNARRLADLLRRVAAA
jgi:glycosyltransferase involved in cell wall biosynthesis